MKTSTKWIIGILVGVVVVTVVACLGVLAWNIVVPGGGWEYGLRSGRLWSDQRMPFHGLDPDDMPMSGFQMRTGSWFGFFGLARLLGGALLCLGLPLLIIIGVVLLIRNNSTQTGGGQVETSAPPTQVPAQTAETPEPQPANPCGNCGKPVQSDWSNCPYCGNPL